MDEREAEQRSNLFDVAALLLLIGLAGSRAITVGTDTWVYASNFARIPRGVDFSDLMEATSQEVGYAALSYAVRSLGGDFTSLLWAGSAITVLAAYWALKRVSKNFVLALVLYVMVGPYLSHFNTLRQGIAVSVLFLAATFLGKRRGWVAYVPLAAFATSFHSSAIVAAIMLPIFINWKVTVRRLVLTGALVVALSVALWGSPWLAGIVESFNPDYTVYLSWTAEAGIGLYLLIAARVGLLLYATALRPSEDDMKYAAWATLGVAWLVLGTQSVIVSRLSEYFLVFLCVLIPNVMRDREMPKTHVFAMGLAAAVYFVFYLGNYGALVPYAVAG